MLKPEIIAVGAEKLQTTKVAVTQLIKDMDVLISAVAENLKCGEKAKVGEFFTIEKVFVAGKEGVLNGNEYKTEDREVVRIKATQAGKDLA